MAVLLTGGSRNDVTQLLPLLHAIPPIRGKRGRPRSRPGRPLDDRGYDHDSHCSRLTLKVCEAARPTARKVLDATTSFGHRFNRHAHGSLFEAISGSTVEPRPVTLAERCDNTTGVTAFRHRGVGIVDVAFEVFEMPGQPGVVLVSYSTPPGTDTAEKFAG